MANIEYANPKSEHGDAHDPNHMHIHVVPLWFLAFIFAILMVLTFVTVAATWVDFGYNVNLGIAIFIAVIKAALVGLYFMHLRWDTPFNSLSFVGSLVFVGLFIFVGILDTGQYSKNVNPPQGWQQQNIQTPAK